jgi:integrase
VFKRDAERWVVTNESARAKGDWIDPDRGRLTVAEWAPVWFATKATLKPKSRLDYDSVLRTQVLPRWGSVPLNRIAHADVVAWVAELSRVLGPSRTRKALYVLSQCLRLAIRDGRLARDPTVGIKRPSQRRGRQRFLTHAEVDKLAAECASPYDLFVLVVAYTGLRFGEAAGLRVGDVDLDRGRLRVEVSLVEVLGQLEETDPKSHRGRTVPVPRFLRDRLAGRIEGRRAEDRLFTTPNGHSLRNSNFRHQVFDPAVRRASLSPLTPHDLRDTAASLAVASGATVKAVQRMLGHASAAMTLDVYAGLFDDELDDVADRMSDAAEAARVVRTDCGPDGDSDHTEAP